MFIGFNTQAQHLTITMANLVSILLLLLELDLVPLETCNVLIGGSVALVIISAVA
jgi:hypothetical protein